MHLHSKSTNANPAFCLNENLLHYIWRTKNFDQRNLVTTCRKNLKIHSFGVYNHDAGPDFLGAHIQIENQHWHGHVEMHLDSSDWYRHGHDKDQKYQNVILHVVLEETKYVSLKDGTPLPCLAIKPYIFSETINNYTRFKSSPWIPCGHLLGSALPITLSLAKERMLAVRFESHARILLAELNNLNGDLNELIYRQAGRVFGLTVNTFGFELLTRLLPYGVIRKHREVLFQIEAIVFGTSGLIPSKSKSKYTRSLRREFTLLNKKYNLQPINGSLWKFSKMRPGSFPTIKLALFSSFLNHVDCLEDLILNKTKEQILQILSFVTSNYWNDHYRFDIPSKHLPKKLGAQGKNSILINLVVPVLYAYGLSNGDPSYQKKAYEYLFEIDPEVNSITRNWKKLGVKCSSAADSQALITLKKEMCDNFKCLSCPIGHKLISP